MKMFIGGQYVDASNGETIQVINPANMEVIDTVPAATEEDVDRALTLAEEGFKEWKKVPLYERIKIFERYAELIVEHGEEYAQLACKETGKVISANRYTPVGIAQLFRFYAEKARNLGGESFVFDSEPAMSGDVAFTIRDPIGEVFARLP